MQYRTLGKAGLRVSAIGFGTWQLANDDDSWVGATRSESEKALLTALDNGVNFIDTARVYGNGLAEEWIGDILAKRPSAEVVLASKMYPKNQEWSGMEGVPISEAFPRDHIIKMVDWNRNFYEE